MLDDKLDAIVASEDMDQLAQQDVERRELTAEKASKRYVGGVNKRTGLYKIKGERFNPLELARWSALKRANQPIVPDTLAAYDRGEWTDERGLQSWLGRGTKYGRYTGARPKKPMGMPHAGYVLRACIALRPD